MTNSIAAIARAKAEARAKEAAEALAAAEAKPAPKRLLPAVKPDVAVPDVGAARALSPAARRKLLLVGRSGLVMAAIGVAVPASAENENLPMEGVQLLNDLDADRRRLKEIQSVEHKIEAKRGMLPAYMPWVAGALQNPPSKTRLDEIAATVMIWSIDTGEFEAAMPIAQWLLQHNVDRLPGMDRTTATFVTEEIAEAALKAYRAGGDEAAAFRPGVLALVEDLVEIEDEVTGGRDMPDQVRAKLQKAIAHGILAGIDAAEPADARKRQEEALRRFQRALKLHDAAGVKKDIEQLQRILNKPDTPPA